MSHYYSDAHVTIYCGDMRDVLPSLDRVETCITDPPYGLAFMGKAWDHAVPDETYWRLVRDAILPGGMLLAFGGTRLWHWLAVGIEQAGWEIRDTLMWMYGSGFPKSLDISKAIDKAARASWFRRHAESFRAHFPSNSFWDWTEGGHAPSDTWWAKVKTLAGGGHLDRNVVAVLEKAPGWFTTGAARIDSEPATEAAARWNGWGTALKPAWEPIVLAMNPLDGTFAGNAVEHGVAGLNVDGARINPGDFVRGGGNGQAHNRGYGARETAGTRPIVEPHSDGRWPANLILDTESAALLDEQSGPRDSPRASGNSNMGRPSADRSVVGWTSGDRNDYQDAGGASRFFYTAKASRSDRGPNNDHPTVKPSDLMKWLCTLTKTPKGGTVLDPFMGSGTTLYAAKETGRKAIGIEIEERYCEIAAQRCSQEVLAL